MKALRKLRKGLARKPRRRQAPERRRRDPDYGSLPGGSSAREAAQASPERAGELAD